MTRHPCSCYGNCDHPSGFCDRDAVGVNAVCDYCTVMRLPEQRTPKTPVSA